MSIYLVVVSRSNRTNKRTNHSNKKTCVWNSLHFRLFVLNFSPCKFHAISFRLYHIISIFLSLSFGLASCALTHLLHTFFVFCMIVVLIVALSHIFDIWIHTRIHCVLINTNRKFYYFMTFKRDWIFNNFPLNEWKANDSLTSEPLENVVNHATNWFKRTKQTVFGFWIDNRIMKRSSIDYYYSFVFSLFALIHSSSHQHEMFWKLKIACFLPSRQ